MMWKKTIFNKGENFLKKEKGYEDIDFKKRKSLI